MKCWYAVQTRVREENKAILNLRNQGFAVFLPLYKKTRRHARKTDVVLRPLFPGYLFVEMDARTDQWHSIKGTFGVVRLVSSGDAPSPIPPGIVETIMERGDAGGVIQLNRRSLQHGERVRVIDGPFAEYEGLFEEMIDENRVFLLLDLLGRKVRAQVPYEALAATV